MVNLKSKLKQAQKQRGALLVMNLVIIALCLILFWGTIHMFRQLNDAFSRPAKTNWMENNVQSENYAYLVVNYHEDMVYGGLLSGTKKECYGVARYFEAASMYKAFLQRSSRGDTNGAARRNWMQDSKQSEYRMYIFPCSFLSPGKGEEWMPHMKKWVTGVLQRQHQGETLCQTWTSETLFCDFYKNDIHSYRDLPKVYNQWCSVVRWEKETRPFLRSREFLWQEGHTAHATAEESQERTLQMLNVYAKFLEEVLAIPAIKGQKTEKEKFAGAIATYTVEALMHDGKALQSGTSHNFGDGFAKAFGIQFADKDNTLKYVHQTSWGMTTRLIGALIMVHGDNEGLVIPPRVAPIQICIVPVMQKKEGVLDKAYELRDRLAKDFRVKVDDSDKTPGFKFAEAEMRGYPIRVEIGPKDIEAGKCVICRRDTREKTDLALEELDTKEPRFWSLQKGMPETARAHRDSHTSVAHNDAIVGAGLQWQSGFVKAMWCGCRECEDRIKEKLAVTSRCMPFEQEQIAIAAYVVENLRKRWYTGEEHTKVYVTIRSEWIE